MKPIKTATITRLTPEGSTLADASGKPIPVGATIEEGAALVLSTPDGSSGAVSMTARLVHTITSKRLTVVDAFGPSTGGPMAIDIDT